jgi:riboflavin synthase
MSLGSPAGLLLALVVLKTVVDITFHRREHQKKEKRLKTAAAQR